MLHKCVLSVWLCAKLGQMPCVYLQIDDNECYVIDNKIHRVLYKYTDVQLYLSFFLFKETYQQKLYSGFEATKSR